MTWMPGSGQQRDKEENVLLTVGVVFAKHDQSWEFASFLIILCSSSDNLFMF